MRTAIICGAVTALAGCQGAGVFGGGTGVLPVGPDTYTLTQNAITSFGGTVTAQQQALTIANEYCQQQGRQFLLSSAQPSATLGSGTYSIIFRCYTAGDPDLRRPNYRPSPNIVIENRRPPG
jgi:hypothetical protein